MKKILIGVSLSILALMFYSCQLEQIHTTLPISFEFTTNCYSASFTTTSQGAYNWEFGDGNISTEQNPSHEYSLPGSYEVSLTISTENGKGKVTKEVEIIVSANTFNTSSPDLTGFSFSPNKDGGGGYRIIGHQNTGNSNEKAVYKLLQNGGFDRLLVPGSVASDYVAYLNPEAFAYNWVRNNRSNGTVEWHFSSATNGIFRATIGLPDTSFEAKNLIRNDNELSFTTGFYTSDPSKIEGVFLCALSTTVFNNTLIELPNPKNVKIAHTPDGGAILSAIVPDQGIYVAKFDDAGQQLWGRYLANTSFRIDEYLPPTLAILALGNNDFVVATAEYKNWGGRPTSDANAKGYFIRFTETSETWRTVAPEITHVNDILLTQDGRLMACGAFNNDAFIIAGLIRLTQDGTLQYAKGLPNQSEEKILWGMTETENGEYVLFGNSRGGSSFSMYQVDCGGNF